MLFRSGHICVDIVLDFGEKDVLCGISDRLLNIFTELRVACPIEQDGHHAITLLLPTPAPTVADASANPLVRISNGVCGCAKGILEVINHPVCADTADSDDLF